MADRKISELTNITGANVDDANDEIAIVDASASETKAITREELFSNVPSASFTSLSGNLTGNVTGELDLSAIAETKADTAVDVFVYDTSKDSDGGAWRHRTQHTSWYNETLNTATRGSRREFPAVAVIVAESDTVTIYDGDDPALPMWMVFNAALSHGTLIGSNGTISSVFAKNNNIVVGTTGPTANQTVNGCHVIDFLSDGATKYRAGSSYSYGANIVDRNNNFAQSYLSQVVGAGIVSNFTNDVAMTVLPDAPIDPATGIQRVTIACATDGGVSVIKDDGTVVDSAITSACDGVEFSDGVLIVDNSASGANRIKTYLVSDLVADGFVQNGIYRDFDAGPQAGQLNILAQTLQTVSLGDTSIGSDFGVTSIAEDQSTPANGMVAYTTSTYNTGWMNGDIKLAALSDTDDTDLVGSGELVTNGDFATNDFTGWTVYNDADASASTGAAVFGKEVGNGDAYIQQVITVTPNKPNVITFDIVSTSGGYLSVRDSGGIIANYSTTSSGSFSLTYTSNDSTLYLRFVSRTEGATITIDNISVKLADEDRSVNNNGLIVNGTITRTFVDEV